MRKGEECGDMARNRGESRFLTHYSGQISLLPTKTKINGLILPWKWLNQKCSLWLTIVLSPLFSVRMIAYCRFNSWSTKHQNETEDSVPSPISVREGDGRTETHAQSNWSKHSVYRIRRWKGTTMRPPLHFLPQVLGISTSGAQSEVKDGNYEKQLKNNTKWLLRRDQVFHSKTSIT